MKGEYEKIDTELLMHFGSLEKILASVYLKEPDVDLEQLLREIPNTRLFRNYSFHFKYRTIKCGENLIYKIDLIKKPNKIENKELRGMFYLVQTKEDVLYVVTDSNMEFLNKAVHTFLLRNCYPLITKVYFTSRDLKHLLDFIEKLINSKVLVERSSGRRMFGKDDETIVNFKRGKAVPYITVFNKAELEKKWVTWMSLTTEKGKFQISREGNVRLYKGEKIWFLLLLHKMSELGKQYKQRFEKREYVPGLDPKPIILEYNNPIFNDKENRKKLLGVITNYAQSSYSVIHAGNPHIYMYLRDQLDNSCFSIRTVGDSKLLLTPQIRCSTGSLYRLISHLIEKFREFENLSDLTRQSVCDG